LAKKKVRCGTMGPPTFTPNWFRVNGGISPTVPNGRASNLSLRMKSNAVPRKVLVPVFEISCTTPPAAVPDSAE
jgi:hypothetical protein